MLVPVNQKDTAVKDAHIMGLSTSAAATDTAEDCQGSKVNVHAPLEQPSKRTVLSLFLEERIKTSSWLVIAANQSGGLFRQWPCISSVWKYTKTKITQQNCQIPLFLVSEIKVLFRFHQKNVCRRTKSTPFPLNTWRPGDSALNCLHPYNA